MPQHETIALKLAHILIPRRDDGSNLFFLQGARDLLAGVMTGFFLDRGEGSLRDVLSTIRTREGLRAALERHPQTRFLAEWYLPSEYIFGKIRATLTHELACYEDIAGLSFRP
jgi:hypothetical protein